MNDTLQAQLLQLGLVDESQVRKAQQKTEKPTQRKKNRNPREGSKPRGSSLHRELNAARKASAKVASNSEPDPKVKATIDELISQGRRKGPIEGRKRFYFESRDGRVPCLDVSAEVINELETGAAAIVESMDGRITVIVSEVAERLMKLDVTWIRHWNP